MILINKNIYDGDIAPHGSVQRLLFRCMEYQPIKQPVELRRQYKISRVQSDVFRERKELSLQTATYFAQFLVPCEVRTWFSPPHTTPATLFSMINERRVP